MMNKEMMKLLVELHRQGFSLDDIKKTFGLVNKKRKHKSASSKATKQQAPQTTTPEAAEVPAPFVCKKDIPYERTECVYVSENGVSFFVHPKTKKVPLMSHSKKCNGIPLGVQALLDFESVSNTRALAEVDPDSPAIQFIQSLEGDWYIPALGILCIIGRHIDEINDVLKTIEGADLMDKDSKLWSSTNNHTIIVWGLNLASGVLCNGNRASSHYHVRPIVPYIKL